MRSPLNQLILLGFICQGLTWDGYFMAAINLVLWLMCVNWPKRPVKIPQAVEGAALLVGTLAGYAIGKAMGLSTHFALGHGITLLQAVRMLRAQEKRDKYFTLIAAFLQLGVGCTVIIDFRFIVILIAAVCLIPGALRELATTDFSDQKASAPRRKFAWGQFTLLFGTAALVFMLFPRGLLGSGGVPGLGGSSGSLLDAVLDPASGGVAQSGRVIFEVQGDNIGYLRSLALTEFDGETWHADERPALRRIDFQQPDPKKHHLKRVVRVKDVNHLGRIVPTDGHVIAIGANYFNYPLQDLNETIRVSTSWSMPDARYEYWIDEQFGRKSIFAQERSRLTQHPDPSPEVRQWMTNVLGTVRGALPRARKLEAYLRENFTYRIGAPRLNRLDPLEDFLLQSREGHCERFASALALLLRMEGTPSRVIVGYVADQKNALSGWRPVRFKDAHAWTEGWFEGVGWVQFDATPRRTLQRSLWDPDLWLENIDFVWNVYVVNFDAPSQKELLRLSTTSVGIAMGWLYEHTGVLTITIAGLLGLALWKRRRVTPEMVVARKRQKQLAHASHQYGHMLTLFEKLGFNRAPQQTPLEFLHDLKAAAAPAVPEAEVITQHFCALRYGQHDSVVLEQQVDGALERLKGILSSTLKK